MKEPDFDLSADMRLLELQRGALGLPDREKTAWETPSGSNTGLPMPSPPVEAPAAQGAVIHVEAAAHPAGGVIPGAVVTLTLSLANDGAVAATGIVAGAPLPGGASYRPGSFLWNGRSSFDDVAETFLGAGLPIGALGPGERASFQWKIGVKLGTKPLVLAPHVRAGGAAVLGARPLSIDRKVTGAGPFSTELAHAEAASNAPPLIPVDIPVTELPIYELDPEEEIVEEAAHAALSSAVPRQQPEAGPEPQPSAAAARAPEPKREPAKASAPREAVALYGRFDRATIAFFERSFSGSKPPSILQHCILASALACTEAAGGDVANLKRHLDGQAQVLHRIGLHEKLGKKEPIAEYAGDLVASLEHLKPAAVAAQPLPKDALLLSTELSAPTVAVLQRITDESGRWDFVKARQLTLALQAESAAVAGIDEALRARIDAALRAYAQASVGVLQKLFVRMRIDRTTGVLQLSEPALDAAARALISAFKLALP